MRSLSRGRAVAATRLASASVVDASRGTGRPGRGACRHTATPGPGTGRRACPAGPAAEIDAFGDCATIAVRPSAEQRPGRWRAAWPDRVCAALDRPASVGRPARPKRRRVWAAADAQSLPRRCRPASPPAAGDLCAAGRRRRTRGSARRRPSRLALSPARYSSRTQWKLLPPKPNALTAGPARMVRRRQPRPLLGVDVERRVARPQRVERLRRP